MNRLNGRRLLELVRAFKGCSVAILGDLILDRFIWGTVERISPEAPVPVVAVQRESELPGGAANVASNVVALGGRAELAGLVGTDPDGDRLLELLAGAGVGCDDVIRQPGRTTCKTRIIAHHQQVCRFDREARPPVEEGLARLARRTTGLVKRVNSVVISDYAKGAVDPLITSSLIATCRAEHKFVAADPKRRDFGVYGGVSLITPNLKEAEQATGLLLDDPNRLLAAARIIRRQARAGEVLITLGERGMTLFDGRDLTHIAAVAREVFDVTGAGDTVIATVSLAKAAGATTVEAALLANLAAGIVVGKLGTATVSAEELEAAVRSHVESGGGL
jgi:D-beta-D-heptose 7-phosphate kinase/D-beta-D-heptose 1-phosphate adenosyltransferase